MPAVRMEIPGKKPGTSWPQVAVQPEGIGFLRPLGSPGSEGIGFLRPPGSPGSEGIELRRRLGVSPPEGIGFQESSAALQDDRHEETGHPTHDESQTPSVRSPTDERDQSGQRDAHVRDAADNSDHRLESAPRIAAAKNRHHDDRREVGREHQAVDLHPPMTHPADLIPERLSGVEDGERQPEHQ